MSFLESYNFLDGHLWLSQLEFTKYIVRFKLTQICRRHLDKKSLFVLQRCLKTFLLNTKKKKNPRNYHYNSKKITTFFICCLIGVLTLPYNKFRTVYQELKLFWIYLFVTKKRKSNSKSYWKEVGYLTLCFDLFTIEFWPLKKPWCISCQHNSYSVSWDMFFSTIFLEIIFSVKSFMWYVYNAYKEK